MIDIVLTILLSALLIMLVPMIAVTWKMAIEELFGCNRRRQMDRLIDQKIAEIEQLAEDMKS
jgi:hypothetical protein